jgi:hypothetical protein
VRRQRKAPWPALGSLGWSCSRSDEEQVRGSGRECTRPPPYPAVPRRPNWSSLAVPLTSGGGLLSGVKLKKHDQELTLGSKVGLRRKAAILGGSLEPPGVARNCRLPPHVHQRRRSLSRSRRVTNSQGSFSVRGHRRAQTNRFGELLGQKQMRLAIRYFRASFDEKGDVYGYKRFVWYVWQEGDYAPLDPAELAH